MAAKRVETVHESWSDSGSSSRKRSRKLKLAKLKPIRPTKLEKDVDAVLRAKGLQLSQSLVSVLNEFKRRESKLKPFKRKRPSAGKRLR